MSNNVQANPGTGGATWTTIDKTGGTGGGVQTPAVMIDIGSGTTLSLVTASNPLPGNILQVGDASFSLGQQLAASSLPIVLTAAQLTTLTPPPAITNYAIETGGNLATLAGAVSGGKEQVNLAQVGGGAVAQGHGLAATAIRVELPTDGTGVVGLNAGANTIGAVTQASGPWSQNITQIAGAAIAQGHGTAAAAIRVELPTDGTGIVGLAAGAATIGAVTQASGPWTSNITQVAGAAISQGHGLAAAAIRVELPTDGTGVVGLNAGTNKIGIVTTDQTTHGTTDLVAADITKIAGSAVATAASGIIKVGITDGSGTALTSTGNALDENLKSTSITLPGADDVTQLFNGQTTTAPQFAKISCAASGDNTIVTGVSLKRIRVHSIFLTISGTAISVYFRDGTGGTAICADATNSIPLDKTGATGPAGFSLPYNPVGHWTPTTAGNGLVINLSGAQGVCGSICYSQF